MCSISIPAKTLAAAFTSLCKSRCCRWRHNINEMLRCCWHAQKLSRNISSFTQCTSTGEYLVPNLGSSSSRRILCGFAVFCVCAKTGSLYWFVAYCIPLRFQSLPPHHLKTQSSIWNALLTWLYTQTLEQLKKLFSPDVCAHMYIDFRIYCRGCVYHTVRTHRLSRASPL